MTHLFPTATRTASQPALPDRVVDVVQLSAEEEMSGTNALRVVAVVTDDQTRGDHPARQLPRHPMRPHAALFLGAIAGQGDLAVATLEHPAPFPTALALLDLRPEPT